jgi:hypothetical protein
LLGLAAILALALALRGWRLGASGFITPYYMAGVRSMTVSWHNFFFNAFDPTGFVSLDKPPIAFWAQTLSVKTFGFSPFGVLLPQLLEGLLSILLLYHLVKRAFGTGAGLLAALFLALTPIAIAVDRSNNTDTGLVLILLLAAWALSHSVETGRCYFLLLSAALVGIGFNVKMLVAFGVLPVFILLHFVGGQIPLRRRIGHLAAAGLVLAAVSLAWTAVYDLTPPQKRPFVDSTTGNSMFELIVGENFIKRFVPRGDRSGQSWAAAVNPNTTPRSNHGAGARAGLRAGRTVAPRGATLGGADGLALPTGAHRRARRLVAHPSIPAVRSRAPVPRSVGWLGVVLRGRIQCRRRSFSRLLPGRDGTGIVRAGRNRNRNAVVALRDGRSESAAVSDNPNRHSLVAGLHRQGISNRGPGDS